VVQRHNVSSVARLRQNDPPHSTDDDSFTMVHASLLLACLCLMIKHDISTILFLYRH